MEPSRLTQEHNLELKQFAEGLNEQLRSASSGGAEQAFGLGCGLGLIPVLGMILVLWTSRVVSLIPALLLVVIGLVALVGVSLLLAQVARSNASRRVYQADIEPEIDRFLNERKIPRQLFDDVASQSLPADAPLQAFLSPSLPGAELESIG